MDDILMASFHLQRNQVVRKGLCSNKYPNMSNLDRVSSILAPFLLMESTIHPLEMASIIAPMDNMDKKTEYYN